MDNKGMFMPDAYMKASLIRKHYESVRTLSNDFDLESLSYADKEECLFNAEQVALAIRQSLCDGYDRNEAALEMDYQPEPLPDGDYDALTSSNCVKMSAEQGMIRFWVPNMVIRTSAHSWYMATMVKAYIRSYMLKTGINISSLVTSPAHIIIKRKACVGSSLRYADIQKYRDNENLETSKLINEICSSLGFTDNAITLGYTSIFEKVDALEKEGTEIILFSSERLDDFYKNFSF